MKKLLIAALMAVACVVSASAMTVGLRGDVDFGNAGFKTTENGKQTPDFIKADTVTSGSGGIWVDIPLLNLKVLSLGLRPEFEFGFNQGFVVKQDDNSVKLTSSNVTIPLFLDVCVNILSVRLSLGIGPYLSLPISFVDTETKFGTQTIQKPTTAWDAHSWGIAAYLQAGLKLGPGYLLVDGRASTPFGNQDWKAVTASGDSGTVITAKTYSISVGIGYEFTFE